MNCTLLVSSCAKYRDVLDVWTVLFSRYWPDCPFEKVLVTDEALSSPPEPFDRVIATSPELSWSAMLTRALDAIETDYVLLMLDDYLLCERVDTSLILSYLADAIRLDAAKVQFYALPAAHEPFDATYGQYIRGRAYAISAQAGIWRRTSLRDVTAKTQSAWQFERYGSYFEGSGLLLCTLKRRFWYLDAVHKGYWATKALRFLKREGIKVDLVHRPPPKLCTRIKEAFKSFAFAILPHDWIVKTQNFCERMFPK